VAPACVPSTHRVLSVNAALHIAVVDDEVEITRLLAAYLARDGYRVTQLHHGAALLELIASDPPHLVLLDLGLPGEDGFAVARRLRTLWRGGLVMVTGRGEGVDKIVGLEVGADDYVTKPFDLRELLARVKAVLRRTAPEEPVAAAPVPAAPTRLAFAGFLLDIAARRLTGPDGREIVLTSGEFDLLCALAQNAGRVLSRDFLLERTRGREAAPFDRTIDVQVGRLRKKLDDDPENPRVVKSVRGAGYVFVAAVTAG
jgi:two-component system, OmpR family, response regulator